MPTLSAAEQRRIERRIEEASRLSSRLKTAVTRRTGLTSSGLIVAGLAALCWLVAYVAGGRPLYLLSYACIGVLGLAFALTSRAVELEGTRSAASPRVREGENVDIEISLTGARRFTTFVLEEEIPPTLGPNPRVSVAAFEPGSDLTHTYSITLWRRGAYELGPLVVRWGDPFGLTLRRKTLAPPYEVLVHPSVELVQERPLTRLWEDPPIRPPISRPWPQGMEFYGMREYQRGDDVRRIVWRAYARTHKLLVRESEQGVTDKLVVLVDNDRATHEKGALSPSFEAGIKVAASVVHRHIDQGYNVTLESNDRRHTGPVRGPGAVIGLLDDLARLERSRATLADALLRLVHSGDRDAQVIIITPLLDLETAGRLQLLTNRGNSVLVAALMWAEDAVDTLSSAAALGAEVVEIRPNASLGVAFAEGVVGGSGGLGGHR